MKKGNIKHTTHLGETRSDWEQVIRPTLIFVVFSIMAAPLEFHMNWYYELRNGADMELAVNKSLVTGVLFFYSVTVSIESILRLDSHPEITKRLAVTILKILCVASLLPFLLEFTQLFRTHRSPDRLSYIIQISNALLSLMLATISHLYLTKVEATLAAED